jgi:hypothetical protein
MPKCTNGEPDRKLLLQTQRVQTDRRARLQTDQSFEAMIYLAQPSSIPDESPHALEWILMQ